MKKMLLSLSALTLLSACASSPMPAGSSGNRYAQENDEVVTGSNIKKRGKQASNVSSISEKDEISDYRQQMPEQPAPRGI
ncbi:hypothetical protein ACL9RI_06080 [Janthinobacterium sp. Mn2066]|uniref:hypothetical protein n=1 Tax=Janthinobacterium sp. Mn2066 TaxID=3395264 RepID=UPI003BC2B9F3